MNPHYSNPRQIPISNASSVPSYNHPKSPITSYTSNNGPLKSPISAPYIPPPAQTQFKIYNSKVSSQQPKINNNSSTGIKPKTQSSIYQSTVNNINTGSSTNNTQMIKSVISNLAKTKDGNYPFNKTIITDKPIVVSSPQLKRQPRYSQPAQYQSPSEQSKPSFFPFNKNRAETKQLDPPSYHFYKKQSVNTLETNKQEKQNQKQERTREWLKQINRVKKNEKIGLKLENFDKIKNLGKGKYGNVFLVKDKKTNYLCALKIIEKAILIEDAIIDQFIRQIKIQKYLNHPNVIKMYGLFDDEKNIYIVLEVAMGGQLFQKLKKNQQMPEDKVAEYMKQICAAVDQLHASRIIHRDIKPENIVLHEGVVKLCDFGWSVHLDNKLRSTFCGTPLYVCPQIIKGYEYDEKIDIWSLGIMMYEMLIGQNPFKINKQEELIKIVKEDISIPSYVYVSKEARDFLNKCLQKNPADRLTIKQAVNHEFFRKNTDRGDKKLSI